MHWRHHNDRTHANCQVVPRPAASSAVIRGVVCAVRAFVDGRIVGCDRGLVVSGIISEFCQSVLEVGDEDMVSL